MKIVWDEPKRQLNLRDHPGMDFADLTPRFFDGARITPAHSNRKMARGRLYGRPIVVIFKPLGTEAISVISMYVKTRP